MAGKLPKPLYFTKPAGRSSPSAGVLRGTLREKLVLKRKEKRREEKKRTGPGEEARAGKRFCARVTQILCGSDERARHNPPPSNGW
eukprot:c23336_g4_i1 orf=474-731(+)